MVIFCISFGVGNYFKIFDIIACIFCHQSQESLYINTLFSVILEGIHVFAYLISGAILVLQETNRLEYLIPKKTSLRHRLPMGDQGFIDFVAHLLEINPKKRPSASEALKHPWLSYPYEPISS